jgi:apolipoprotein N-acyltransferase
MPADSRDTTLLSLRPAIVIGAIAVAAFHLAYEYPPLAFLMGVFLFCIFRLASVRTTRVAFYLGLAIGLAIYAPQLWFFAGIFKTASVAMWLIAAIWISLFLLISRACMEHLPRTVAILSIPILWTGLEYCRSELYYLRFSWLSAGFAFSDAPGLLWPGVYGVGFFLMLAVAIAHLLPPRARGITAVLLLGLVAGVINGPTPRRPTAAVPTDGPFIVGIQLEKASDRDIRQALDNAISRYPQADLLVLSEYTFFGPPPKRITDWCRDHQTYLIVGGAVPLDPKSDQFHNTAFVIGPDGRIIFQQGKSVPIQFLADGLPAQTQEVWDSPWGRLGLCLCYDLSYSRVTDLLVRHGAQAIIVPTMDLTSWGRHEHQLHARVGPTRAAEYGIPVIRVCSSGVSQIITRTGKVIATAPFPGQGEMIAGLIAIPNRGRLPLDRILAPLCVAITAALAVGLTVHALRQRWVGNQRTERYKQDALPSP